MKKILFSIAIISLALVSNVAKSQDFTGSSYGKVLDTVTNSATVYLTSPWLQPLQYGLTGYVIQFDATNLTGTSTITAVLESSQDGLTWSNHFKVPGTNGVNCDTLSISATKQHIWNILPMAASTQSSVVYWTNSGKRAYFRIKLVGGATQSTRVRARNSFQ